jgi:hypothetical protein
LLTSIGRTYGVGGGAWSAYEAGKPELRLTVVWWGINIS